MRQRCIEDAKKMIDFVIKVFAAKDKHQDKYRDEMKFNIQIKD